MRNTAGGEAAGPVQGRRAWWGWVAGLLLLLPPAPAGQAAVVEQDRFELEYRRGVQAFWAERYDEALVAFRAAYQERPLPNLLINIGTVHRKLGQAEQAIAAYREYTRREPNPPPEVTAKLRTLLAQAQALLGSGGGPAAAAVVPRAAPITRAATPPQPRGKTRLARQPAAPRPPLPPPAPVELLPPLPTTAPISALAAAGPEELWAAAGPRVFRYDGRSWTTHYQAWGADLYQVQPTGERGYRTVGSDGQVLVYDGTDWQAQPTGTGRKLLCSLEVDGRLQLLDAQGGVLEQDGAGYRELAAGTSSRLELRSCSVVEGRFLFAVGARGAIVRWDGRRLTHLVSGTPEPLGGVWGSAAQDVWAVGAQGTLLHFDGQRWTPAEPPARDVTLSGVWGSGPQDVWAVGGNFTFVGRDSIQFDRELIGAVWHFDGRRWQNTLGATTGGFRTVWGSGPRDVYVLGHYGDHLHFDGEVWRRLPATLGETPLALAGRGPQDIWAVGESGTLLHFDGTRWSGAHTRTDQPLYALLRRDSGELWAAGRWGTLLRHDGPRWRRADWYTHANLHALGDAGPEELLLGDKGRVVRFDGQRWSAEPLEEQQDTLREFWTHGQEQWAVGRSCGIYRHDGRRWRKQAVTTLTWEPWPDDDNPLLPWFEWPPTDRDLGAPVTCRQELYAIGGPGPEELWAVGERILLHRTAQGWRVMAGSFDVRRTFVALWGSPSGALWIGAASNQHGPPGLLHFDGRRWAARTLDANPTALTGVADRLWIGGEDGRIRLLRLDAARTPGGAGPEAIRPGRREQPGGVVASRPAAPLRQRDQPPQERGKTLATLPPVTLEPLPPLPRGEPIGALTATSPTEVWASAGARIHRFDGRGWTLAHAPWGSSLNQLWGATDGGLWAVGDHGQVLAFDGHSWRARPTGTDRELLCGLEVNGRLQVLDAAGGVLRLEGTDWIEQDTGWTGLLQLLACSPVEGRWLYAVGAGGTVVRWDGQRLTSLVSGTAAPLTAVWGSSARDVWVAGNEGTLLRFDGRRWTPAAPPRRDRTMTALWGTGPTDVWAAGGAFRLEPTPSFGYFISSLLNPGVHLGAVWHFDGQRWHDPVGDLHLFYGGIGGHGPRDIHVLGEGDPLHFDGTGWSRHPRPPGEDIFTLWARGPGDLWAGGRDGTLLHHDGTRWRATHTRGSERIRALVQTSPETRWAVTQTTLLRAEGGSWRLVDRDLRGGEALWAAAPDELFVGGEGRILHVVGDSWSSWLLDAADQKRPVHALWGTSPREVWAVGRSCLIYHFDGHRWIREPNQALPRATWAGGRDPLAFWSRPPYANTTRQPPAPDEPVQCFRDLFAVDGTGPDDVWAAGRGLLLHRTAQGWRVVVHTTPSQQFQALRATSTGELWVAVHHDNLSAQLPVHHALLRFDGRRWEARATDRAITALAQVGSQVWAGDEDGQVRIVHW